MKRHDVQWAGQFHAAAELCRRGYLVSFTLGNAPTVDLLCAIHGGEQFKVEVKSQRTKNFWRIDPNPENIHTENRLFYTLVYVPEPEKGNPRIFILRSADLKRLTLQEKERVEKNAEDKGKVLRPAPWGIPWKMGEEYEDNWGILPSAEEPTE